MSFKLLAIRPLEGCSENVLKNLIADQFYFFDNNFKINDKGGITGVHDSLDIPSNFFYSKSDNTSLQYINVQALVGKNGDGKSSLIEILLRVLNNFYKQYGIGTETNNLLFSQDVVAEVFFEINSKELKIYVDSRKISKIGDNPRIIASACLDQKKIYDSKDYNKENPKRRQDDVDIDHLIFTMYINYSLYGLDESEYYEENQYANDHGFPYDEISKINRFIPDSWLSKIFHKNDGYQTPIVIHPMRKQGQIDIVNEKYLIGQRLLSLIIEESPKKYNITNDLIADKVHLQFKETDHLDVYLKDFVKKTIGINDFAKALPIFDISKLTAEHKIQNIKYLSNFLQKNIILFDKFRSIIFQHHKNKFKGSDLFWIIVEHIICFVDDDYKHEIKSRGEDETIKDYLERIKHRFSDDDYNIVYNVLIFTDGFNFQIYNFFQILSIYYNFWSERLKINQNKLKSGQVEFKLENNLFYYLIIKSFKTVYYPKYQSLNRTNTIEYFAVHLKSDEATTINPHKEFLELISKEDKSHISLKLRQTMYILDLALQNPENKLIEFYKSLIGKDNNLSFSILNSYMATKTTGDKLLMLPPRVFETNIFLKSERTKQNNISIKKVSSGEYQIVAILSSLIYHLKNLDSVESQNATASKSVKAFKLKPIYSFKHVNLILDEIELYFHPEFQRIFIKELLDRLSKISFKNIENLNILFITHSPFILSDIPKQNVLFLDIDEKTKRSAPQIYKDDNTFGANIHEMLTNGFFLQSTKGKFAISKINEFLDFYKKKDYLNEIDFLNKKEYFKSIISLVGEVYIRKILQNQFDELNKKFNQKYLIEKRRELKEQLDKIDIEIHKKS